jgi:hypothetical protein
MSLTVLRIFQDPDHITLIMKTGRLYKRTV